MKFWLRRYQIEGNIANKPHPPKPRLLSEEQENEIVRSMEEDPFQTAIHFARQHNVSTFTIRSMLKRRGLRCRTAARQTMKKEEHKINRMAYCEVMKEWDDNRLNSIIFSDEKTFSSDVKWKANVYRPHNMRFDPHYVKSDRLSGRISASYWGAISIDGPATDLIKIDGKLNSDQYIGIIKRHLFPIMQNSTRIFMQDNSPVHSAGKVMALLSRQPFETIDWPPFSPDLNPIENVWAHLVRDWPMMERRTQEALDELVQRRWNELRNNPGK